MLGLALPLAMLSFTATGATAAPRAHAAGGHVVALVANPTGLLKYNKTSVTVAPGKVTIRLTNKSPLQHDVVLVNSKNKILGRTPVFKGGTRAFSVKLTKGKYTYYCSVPGHRQAGMQGTLNVT